MSVTFSFICMSDNESCMRAILTNSGSTEAGKLGITRGTCFVVRRPEMVAVAGILRV